MRRSRVDGAFCTSNSGSPIIANTGVRLENVAKVLEVADAAIVGTSLKRDGNTWSAVDPERVHRFMETVRSLR